MDSVISKVQNIELKVKKLTLLLEQYKTDCALLKEENLRLKRNLDKNEVVSSESNSIEAAIPIASPTSKSANSKTDMDREAMKTKLDRYIKEVDKCIELVNNW